MLTTRFRYMRDCNMERAGRAYGVVVKKPHTIVDMWPARLKLQPGQPGAQKEFDVTFEAGLKGDERYMEWKRI